MSTSSGSQKSTGAKRGPKRQKTNGDTEDRPAGNDQPSTSNDGQPCQHRIPMSLLNPYITCSLCKGYFIDAVTVMDCLHTFCKSCLIKYFDDHNDCPTCHALIHQSHPTHYVSFDRTLQEIVYKLVPGLQAEEQRRRYEFMEERQRLGLSINEESDSDDEEKRTKRQKRLKSGRGGLGGGGAARNGGTTRNGVCGTKVQVEKEQLNGEDSSPPDLNGDLNKQCCTEADAINAHHRKDEAALIHLIPADDSSNPIHRPYIRVSGKVRKEWNWAISGDKLVFATINTLKRTLALCLRHGDLSHYNDYDIFCNNELMGRDYSILFIQKTRWRDHSPDEPIQLVYKKHKEL